MTTPAALPAYRRLCETGELAERARLALARLADCDLCARYCRVDRRQGIAGAACRTGRLAVVSSHGPHHGEESCLSGWQGSGTIFFSWCNLRCLYCQNSDISWEGEGRPVSAEELAALMLDLERQGCHNINLVSPSHVVAQFLEALVLAADHGLRLPIVYNSGGYDIPQALALLDGVIDIYMPDLKYDDEAVARRLSKVPNYVAVNQAAIRAMHRQVGDLVVDAKGLARRGLLVRHLVLPGGLAGTSGAMDFLAREISPHTYVNIMGQYRPCHRAHEVPDIDRRPSMAELEDAVRAAQAAGLQRLDGLGARMA